MSNAKMVQKASGEKEPFSREKLESSLRRSGAGEEAISSIISDIKPWLFDGVSTRKIYKRAFALLAKYKSGIAARYSLKKAIMELGPSGYPFEHFVGEILSHLGFKTKVGQLVQGRCVQHEVDVVATGNNTQYLVECKYYNSQGKFADVKVPLYIHSRFEDIVEMRKSLTEFTDFSFQGWLVTNTRFTTDAIAYGKCCGLHLVSWDYPAGGSLKDIIERGKLFPVTVITSLGKEQKQQLLDSGFVLCSQVLSDPDILDKLGLKESRRAKIIKELEDLVH